MTTLNNLSEEQRRQLAALFLSHGWKLLKTELDARAVLASRSIIYGDDRSKDDVHRGYVKAIDSINLIEKAIFKDTAPQPAPPPAEPPATGRYE